MFTHLCRPVLSLGKSLYKSIESLFGFMLIPLSMVFEGILSSDFKYKLVFRKLSHPLPASRAFTEIAHQDPRIDPAKLRLLLSNSLPQDTEEQNTTWYGFYKKFSSKEQVFDAHKSFLLTRDLAALSFVSIPLSIASYLLWGAPLKGMVIHLAFLSLALLLISIACQNYGNRFVGNVLVEALHQGE